ncbi:P-loop containing nucleoside triphosphate hydrolase protein [Schizopora paradoxa]|uniref:DNA 3'-5' helicase n=1 Tax=Schizopora paradoxa TaxID=27342 RepID=A0A0H2R8E5_9AGAM|nr:P-loop containing nucleoside triphosphate hydrolase protein [Schizopora paradoxa]
MTSPRKSRRLKGAASPVQQTRPSLANTTPSTPRRRKNAVPAQPRKDGLRHIRLTVDDVKKTVRRELNLNFDIEDWQAHTIHKVLSGFDSVCIAGTSYGKSILFEGLAAMNKRKVTIVVCPLKVLEKDQTDQAEAKGLRAIYINEDTSKDPEIWKRVHSGYYSLVYVSPEMLLSPRFRSLLLDESFRKRLQAIAVDEMHLVKEWGEDFRVKYKELNRLRVYTGMDIPFFGCTATATTEIFDIVWEDLQFGSRPFWGVDVGIERPNLQFVVRKLQNEDNPIIDVLNVLPQVINNDTKRDELKKAIIFQKTRDDCCRAVHTLRRCLPEELRDSVQGFYATLSEEAKDIRWESFCKGESRILAATVAASIGCNDRNVDVVVNVDLPESLSAVSQRWGRGGRDPAKSAQCIQLVPSWAFRPEIQNVNPALARVAGVSEKVAKESKQDTTRREKLEKDLEGLINLNTPGYMNKTHCIHTYMRSKFRPNTKLDLYDSLEATTPFSRGTRALDSPFKHPLSWVVLNLRDAPCPENCCNGVDCNPSLTNVLAPCTKDDPRLHAYKQDFIQLKIDRDAEEFDASLCTDATTPSAFNVLRPSSAMSMASTASGSTTTSKRGRYTSLPEKQRLSEMLVEWRESECAKLDSDFTTPQMILPDGHIRTLMKKSYIFLREENLSRAQITNVVNFDLATREHFIGLLSVLRRWGEEMRLQDTPSKTQGRAKRSRAKSPTKQPPVHASARGVAPNDATPHTPTPSLSDDPFITLGSSYRDRAVVRSAAEINNLRQQKDIGLNPLATPAGRSTSIQTKDRPVLQSITTSVNEAHVHPRPPTQPSPNRLLDNSPPQDSPGHFLRNPAQTRQPPFTPSAPFPGQYPSQQHQKYTMPHPLSQSMTPLDSYVTHSARRPLPSPAHLQYSMQPFSPASPMPPFAPSLPYVQNVPFHSGYTNPHTVPHTPISPGFIPNPFLRGQEFSPIPYTTAPVSSLHGGYPTPPMMPATPVSPGFMSNTNLRVQDALPTPYTTPAVNTPSTFQHMGKQVQWMPTNTITKPRKART